MTNVPLPFDYKKDGDDEYWDAEMFGVRYRILRSKYGTSWSAVRMRPHEILVYEFVNSPNEAMIKISRILEGDSE